MANRKLSPPDPRLLIFMLILTAYFTSPAMAANSGVTFQGRIVKPDGAPLSGSYTQFRLQLRTPDSQNCLMYEELQVQDLRNRNGTFSLTINDGTGSRSDSTGLTLDRIFANRGTYDLTAANCISGTGIYVPNSSDGRDLVVLFKDETMSAWEPIPAQKINYVPFAFDSKQIQGYTADSLVRVVNGSGDPITGLSPLSNTQYSELLALLAGTSTQFEKPGQLGGASLPTLGAGQAGQMLSWNGTGWTTAAPSSTVGADSVSSSNIVNGSITGTDLATNIAISTSSTISTSGTMTSNITTARDFRIYDADVAPNESYISFKAPTSLATNYNYVWPIDYGTATHVLTTDGLGGLTWAAPSTASQWLNGPSNAIGYTAGNVGIGTTMPAVVLHVVGSSKFQNSVTDGSVVVATNSVTEMLGFDRSDGSRRWELRSSSSGLFFNEGNSTANRLYISAGGNIGIGTTSPSARLRIAAGTASAGTAPLKLTQGTLLTTPEDGSVESDASGLWFTIGSVRYLISLQTVAGNYSNVQTIGNTTGSITMTPLAGNSVIVNSTAISNSSTTGALIVNGGVGVSGAITTAGSISSGGTVSATNNVITPQIYGSTAASGNVRIDGSSDAVKGNVLIAAAGGRVGIGTTVPSGILHVDGGIASAAADGAPIIIKSQDGGSGGTSYGGKVSIQGGLGPYGGGDIDLISGGNLPGRAKIVLKGNAEQEFYTVDPYTPSSTLLSGPQIGGLYMRNAHAINAGGAGVAMSVTNLSGSSQKAFISAVAQATGETPVIVFGQQTGSTAYNERLRIDTGGRVGIGTTSPTSNLSFSGDSDQTIGLERMTGVASAASLTIQGGGASSGVSNRSGGSLILSGGTSTGSGGSSIRFNVASPGASGSSDRLPAQQMTLSSSGNLGIGTGSPNYRLEVYGNNVTGEAAASIRKFANTQVIEPALRLIRTRSDSTNSVLGFGLSTDYLLGSDGQTSVTAAQTTLAWENTQSNGASDRDSYFSFSTMLDGTLAEKFRINSSGNVGIGTTNPGAKLDVEGDVRIASSSKLYVGAVAVCDNTGCASPSDIRYKENIAPLNDSLEKILKLQGVEYDWIDKRAFNNQHQIGFIAQSVEALYPEAVKTDKNTGFKSVMYDHLVAPVIEALKVLHLRLISLEDGQRLITELKVESVKAKAKAAELEAENVKLKSEIITIRAYLCLKDKTASLCN